MATIAPLILGPGQTQLGGGRSDADLVAGLRSGRSRRRGRRHPGHSRAPARRRPSGPLPSLPQDRRDLEPGRDGAEHRPWVGASACGAPGALPARPHRAGAAVAPQEWAPQEWASQVRAREAPPEQRRVSHSWPAVSSPMPAVSPPPRSRPSPTRGPARRRGTDGQIRPRRRRWPRTADLRATPRKSRTAARRRRLTAMGPAATGTEATGTPTSANRLHPRVNRRSRTRRADVAAAGAAGLPGTPTRQVGSRSSARRFTVHLPAAYRAPNRQRGCTRSPSSTRPPQARPRPETAPAVVRIG